MTNKLGFIVEGQGEFESYKTIVHKITGEDTRELPVLNSWGVGNITNKSCLQKSLSQLTQTNSLDKIIITLDLSDAIRSGFCSCQLECIEKLESYAEEWFEIAPLDNRILKIPDSIRIAVQVKKFETWMIADVQSLIDNEVFNYVDQVEEVDDINPISFIKQHKKVNFPTKNPAFVKSIMKQLKVDAMVKNSSSFRNFVNEVKAP